MPSKITEVLRAREAGRVYRCHGIPHMDRYTVAEHTFQMLVLLEFLHPEPTLALYRAVIRHDLHERYLGDIPGRIKTSHPDLYREWKIATASVVDVLGDVGLTEDEAAWLDAIDKLELWLWCQDQEAMGNASVNLVKADVERRLRTSLLPTPCKDFLDGFYWHRTQELHPEP